MTPCSLVGCSESFGGACCPCLQVGNEPSWKRAVLNGRGVGENRSWRRDGSSHQSWQGGRGMEPGMAIENIALKRCNTLGTGDIQDETTKGQEIFESATLYRHIRSTGRGDRSRTLLRRSYFLIFLGVNKWKKPSSLLMSLGNCLMSVTFLMIHVYTVCCCCG